MNQQLQDRGVASRRSKDSNWFFFLRQVLVDPRGMASVAPSGKQLARGMASALPADAQSVIELGAGTGAITEALIARGIRPSNLFIVEMNPTLHQLLQARYPEASVACGDARDLAALSARWRESRPGVDAISSSLGLLAMPKPIRHAIVATAFDVLRPGGVFIQYTYKLACPIGANLRHALGLEHRTVSLAWRNLPPARVYAYRRAHHPGSNERKDDWQR